MMRPPSSRTNGSAEPRHRRWRRLGSRDVLPFIGCILMVGAAAWLVPANPEPRAAAIEAQLATELNARIGLLDAWQHERRTSIEQIADREDLRSEIRHGDRADLTDRLARVCLGFDGCSVHARSGQLVADFQNRHSPADLVRGASNGRTTQGGVISTDDMGRQSVEARAARARWSVHFATPVFDDGRIVAILVGRARADRQLDPLLSRGRPGRTGETYVVAPTGYMVTRSRFSGPRTVPPSAPLVLDRPAVAVLDGSGAPTHAAREAGLHRHGVDVTGYPDYRGVRVVGAWRWLDDLGAAVITEMDASEVYLR